MTLVEFFTLLIAAAGFWLALRAEIRSRRRFIRLSTVVRTLVMRPVGAPRNFLQMTLNFEVRNPGERSVHLTFPSLRLPKRSIFERGSTRAHLGFPMPDGMTFPYEIQEGRSASCYMPLESVLNSIVGFGFTGPRVKVRGIISNQAGQTYVSPPITLDVPALRQQITEARQNNAQVRAEALAAGHRIPPMPGDES
jgi:hypothetical protein